MIHPDLKDCFWYHSLGNPHCQTQPLQTSIQADVAIIGAGFTGLWTAYHLKQLAPSRQVVIVEAEHAGFGASGRNGGWLMGAIEGLDSYLAGCNPEIRAMAQREVHGIVESASRVLQKENIDCDFAHGGGIYAAARFPEQLAMARGSMQALREAGHGEQDYRWLEADELLCRVNVKGGTGAIYTPHVAAIQPAKLVAGLAAVVRRLGVPIYEQSPVTGWQGNTLHTAQGTVCSPMIVPAIEGYSYGLERVRGYILPFQSGMVVTEPLAAATWDEIGFAGRPVMADFSRLSTYLQRTADDRLVFGARGSYRFGGKPVSQFNPRGPAAIERQALARQFFPVLEEAVFSHAWGGTLGIPRRFAPHLVFDEAGGMACAGGYVGEGVGASFLFGQTLAELIAGKKTDRTCLPWVFNTSMDNALRRWEPEPFRWLGFTIAWATYAHEEALYVANGAPQWHKNLARRLAQAMQRLLS